MSNPLFRSYLNIIKEREVLKRLVGKYGRKDPLVLKQSAKLDRLIVSFQRKALGGN